MDTKYINELDDNISSFSHITNLEEIRKLNSISKLLAFNDEQIAVFNQLTNHLKLINDIVKNHPLMKYIRIDLMIAGGAIRDLLLGQCHNIKDVDIWISPILSERDYDSDRLTSDIMDTIKKRCLSVNLYNEITIKEVQDSTLFYSLLRYVINESFYIEDVKKDNIEITNSNSKDRDYKECGINGLIKIKDNKNFFDIDLILINNNISEFINNQFDYGICKTGLSLEKYSSSQLEGNYYQALDNCNFYFSPSFLEDIQNKTLTYNISKLSVEQIETSLFNHLNRIILKYPDYNVKLIGQNKQLETKNERDYLVDKALLFHKLNLLKSNGQHKKDKI